jgi:hypothetical protein
MRHYLLDRASLVFLLIFVPIAYWVTFDTGRWLRAGSRRGRASFPRSEILALKVPAGLVAFGGTIWILLTLVYVLWHSLEG